MKKVIITIVIVIILGATYWLISPLFIDKKVSEESPLLPDTQAEVEVLESQSETQTTVEVSSTLPKDLPKEVATGSFTGFDSIHYGSGTATLIETEEGYILRFEEDFNVANGPDLYVGLGKDGQYIEDSEIARLKGNVGSQNYTLPTDFNLKDTNEVWIWCKAFSVPFAKVVLR